MNGRIETEFTITAKNPMFLLPYYFLLYRSGDQRYLHAIALFFAMLFMTGCINSPVGLSSDKYFESHYCLAGSQSNKLTRAYRYKNPQPARIVPHRFVVTDTYTGKEFGIIVRGLVTHPSDKEVDEFTDMVMDASFFNARHVYLLKDSVIACSNGDVRAVVYILGQSNTSIDISTGETACEPLWYFMTQLSQIASGEAVLDDADSQCPAYDAMSILQNDAKVKEEGLWDPNGKWRTRLHRWKEMEANQKRDVRQLFQAEFDEAASRISGKAGPDGSKWDVDVAMTFELGKLLDYGVRAERQSEATHVLLNVLKNTTNTATRSMAVLGLVYVAGGDTANLLKELSVSADPVVEACKNYDLALLKGESPDPGTRGILGSASPQVRETAVDVLAQVAGKKALPVLIALLKGPELSVKQHAVTAIMRYGDSTDIPALVRIVKTGDLDARIYAASAMGSLVDANWQADEIGVKRALAWWEAHKDWPAFSGPSKE
jgi:hypothetical protein